MWALPIFLPPQLLEPIDQSQIDGCALLHAGIGKAGSDVHLGAVGREGKLLGKRCQVILGIEKLQVRE